ncbi:MAG TPA: hypothetical protein VLY03_05575 [Bacteroidota bacterium]|nr:hypothetical protein [Bacteroidota bacterium]
MAVMIDIVGAAVILGMLILTIANVNLNLVSESDKSFIDFDTQTQLIQLARILEFDIYKAGYSVPRHGAISIADSTKFKFKTDLPNTPGHVDSIMYQLGGYVTASQNPSDRMLARYENLSNTFINYSVTTFKLSYYNSKDSLMSCPVTGNWLDSIKAIRIQLTLQSPLPMDTTYSGGYSYASAMYQKVIYPRNL